MLDESQQLVETLRVHAHEAMESLSIALKVLEEAVEVAELLPLPQYRVDAESTLALSLPVVDDESGGG